MLPLRIPLAVALLSLALLLPAASAQTAWKTYINQRFGFSLEYPAYLKPGPEPMNGAGLNFSNGEFSVTAQGHFTHGNSLQDFYKQSLAAYGKAVHYKVLRKTWFVISGTLPDGTEFYQRFAIQGGNWAEFTATYPSSKKAKYDPVIERISKTFKPFLPGDHYDRIP